MKHKYTYPELNAYKKGFERGKSLQFALNSLWNLYLDGVKMSIFPPIQMVADDVVPSGYSKAYRVGTSHGKTLAIDICMILGRRLGQPKGYYKALGEIIEELEK